jgi:hypothetical protein
MNIKYSRRLITPQGAVLDDSDGDIYIQPSTRVPFIYDASKPIEFKIRMTGDGKYKGNSEFDKLVGNFTSRTAVVPSSANRVAHPSSPAIPSKPISEEVVGGGVKPSTDGKPKEEPAPSGKKEIISDDLIAYGIGILVGASSGGYIASKKNKPVIGGIILGGAIGAGLAWTYLHRMYLLERVNAISRPKPADKSGSNFNGRNKNPKAQRKICKNMECCKKNPDAMTSGGMECWVVLH